MRQEEPPVSCGCFCLWIYKINDDSWLHWILFPLKNWHNRSLGGAGERTTIIWNHGKLLSLLNDSDILAVRSMSDVSGSYNLKLISGLFPHSRSSWDVCVWIKGLCFPPNAPCFRALKVHLWQHSAMYVRILKDSCSCWWNENCSPVLVKIKGSE